jgi:GNAT superfamily N-acetyltransferase
MASAVIGSQRVKLRLLEPDDASLIRRFYWRLSQDTIYRRFMGPVVPPAGELMSRLIDVDHCDRDALIALDARGIAGVARYAALPGQSTYDVAVVVADDWQGKGLGRLLIRRLGHIARLRGITRFHATMFGDNRRALSLVRGLSPRATFQYQSGEIEADIPLRARA